MSTGIHATPTIEISRLSFSDIDLFSEWEIGLGWDIESTQLSAGANEIRFDHFAFPGLLVGHYCAKQSMQHVFAVPDGMVVFMICRARLPFVWCGRQFPPSLMGVARSGRENWDVLPGGWDSYEFMVSEDLIRRTADLREVLGDEQVFFLPVTAIAADGALAAFVWVVDQEGGTVVKQPVELGRTVGTNIAVKGEIEPGMHVVTAGTGYLAEGMKVRTVAQLEQAEPRPDDVLLMLDPGSPMAPGKASNDTASETVPEATEQGATAQ